MIYSQFPDYTPEDGPYYYNLTPEIRNWELSAENYFLRHDAVRTSMYGVPSMENDFTPEFFGIAYEKAESIWLAGYHACRNATWVDLYFPEFFAFISFCTILVWYSVFGNLQGTFNVRNVRNFNLYALTGRVARVVSAHSLM